MFDINRYLDRMRLSHSELADRIGVSRSKVSAWAAGYRRPDYDNIEKLLVDGMTLNEMFGEDVEKAVFKVQPSIDVKNLSEEDCKKIVSFALGTFIKDGASK